MLEKKHNDGFQLVTTISQEKK